MKKVKIKLNTVNNVALFVAMCSEYKEDIDIECGRYIVDGKSLMGMLSMSPDRICEVTIHTDDTDVYDSFVNNMKLWICEEE